MESPSSVIGLHLHFLSIDEDSHFAKELQWIGWRFSFSAGLVSLNPNKRKKLINLIDAISGKTYIHKRDIERFPGLAMWVTQLFSGMRPLLQHFYADLFSSPASLYSIDPGMWPGLWNHLDDSLHFVSTPPGMGIPKNGILVSVRHQSVSNKQTLNGFDFQNVDDFGFVFEIPTQASAP